ncbi:calcium homeostasis endoplasmic reticulum protein [Strongylocentrotus purpuratus]|uniref:Calcium homeostasis endoplasmic reticulum protein n=1 Tax=Strongylocentrotus purpuratus TaxID=7668 RepID=A0A7M7PHU2_STRPU|nr:calcium homeostasis endoplasmic reticulum protein [Strongylocentrotus purpuratus]
MEAVPQPPADTDLQNIIDKLANFVARNGTDFEMMTKEKQKNNPKFGFLFGGEYYNYYQYKVTSEQRSIQQQKDKLAQQQAIIQDVITQQSIQSAPWQPQIQQQQQLEEQIAQIEEQISQSEENLGKQKEVLLQQQNDQIESVLANSREKAVIGIATELDVNLSELDSRLQAIIDACTKDAISNGKQWIFSTARSPKHCVLIAKYLLHQILAKAAPFTAKLHLIYLINDVLYHCTRRNAHDLQHALEDTVAPIFCSTHAVADEDQKGKLEKVLKLWGTNNYFDSSVMERLKNPAESLALYQGTRITENGEAIQQLHIASQSQLAVLQKQHNDYVVHMRQQQAQYQQQQQQQQQQQVQQQLAAVAVSTPLPQVPTPFSMAQQMPPQVTQQVTQSMQPQVVPQVAISTVSGGFPPATSEAQAVGSAAPPPTGQQLAQNVSLPQGMLPGSDPMVQAMSSMPPGMPPQIGGQPPTPQMPPQLPAGLPPMDPSLFPGGFPPVFNPSVPPPNIRPPFPFPPGALPPNFTLPPNFDFSKPPPCFLPGMDFPPIPMPPIAAPPPAQDPNDPSLMPRVPYYDLPAGLMAPLVSLEDTDYNPLDHDDIRLPPPQAPSERLLAAVEAFYAPPSRDAPRNSEGWEQNGLFEFFKAKQKYSKLKKEREKENPKEHKPLSPLRVPANSDRSPSPTPPPAARQLTPPPKQESRRRFRSRSRSLSRSPSPSPARSPPRRSRRSRTRSRSRSPPPSRFFRRTSRSKSRSKSRSPPPSYRRESKREPSPTRESKARSPTKRSPSPTEDYGVQPFYQMHVDVKLGEDNKGHQLMKKMGWTGQGLGAKEQGIVNPIASGDVRHDLDKFKGIGMDINDPFESFRKSKSYTYNRRK